MKATSADAIRTISSIVEPWLYVEVTSQPFVALGLDYAGGPFGFETAVRVDPGMLAAEASARLVRATLLKRAEDALDALALQGWHLTSYPAMEFTGQVRPFVQTIHGEMVRPSEQALISMKMQFEVNWALPLAEKPVSAWFASYTTLRDGDVARTICVGDSIMIDLDAEGRPVGVETLDPDADWCAALATLAMAGQMKLAHGTAP